MSLLLSDCNDGELAALALTGRQAAYRELLSRHRSAVFRLVRATIGDQTEALDVTQEVFVSAFAALKRYDAELSFVAWLKRIALNKCRDWARRRAVRSFFTRALPLEDAYHVVDDQPLPETQVFGRVELARVSGAIAKLPASLREVLVLRAVDGLAEAEAAEVLGVSHKAIETRLSRARAKLKEMLG